MWGFWVHRGFWLLTTYAHPYSPRIGFLRFTKFCWVGKHVNIIMKPTDQLPNPRPTQPKKKKEVKSGNLGHFFSPQQIFFGWLGLVLCRKQTTRNPAQPNLPQTPYTINSTVLREKIGRKQIIVTCNQCGLFFEAGKAKRERYSRGSIFGPNHTSL